ncbi:hypothetical protein HanXRQr2_Chr14g0626521 [Helianthus annuus]|uniref:Uncharacterized protein n=1 Tax=Helianthus annuus TaxID=4232 RepID=A0A9K3H5X9_HELAN|nr:hypothetical protein HanXRQr2_Chr14g0626521 [Helianthus annuus]
MLNVLQVDLAGFVIWCGSLEFVGRTSKCNQGYKMDLNFIDEEIEVSSNLHLLQCFHRFFSR